MISIIIPVLNEERTIEDTIKRVQGLKGDKEIIIVDGGSSDRTREIAAASNIKCIVTPRGRGIQMNGGAAEATGDILWFLHADSIIHINSIEMIQKAITQGYIGGGFTLYFHDYDSSFMKFVSITSNWRAKYLGLYYGDQGIFLKKDIFLNAGKFPEFEIMEDWALSRRLKGLGKMKMLALPIGTSARRFIQGGQLKTLLLMHKIKLLYTLGVSPSKLSKIYREAR